MRPVFAYGGGGSVVSSRNTFFNCHPRHPSMLYAQPSRQPFHPFPLVPGMMTRQRSALSTSMFPGRHEPGITNRAHTGRLHVVRLAHISFSSFPLSSNG